jgi:hypothetical protein
MTDGTKWRCTEGLLAYGLGAHRVVAAMPIYHQACYTVWSFDSVSEEYAASIFRLHLHISDVQFPLVWTKFCSLSSCHEPSYISTQLIYFFLH